MMGIVHCSLFFSCFGPSALQFALFNQHGFLEVWPACFTCYCHLLSSIFISSLLLFEAMSYQVPPGYVVPSQGGPPQGHHYYPQGNVRNTYSNQHAPFQSHQGYNPSPHEQYVPPNVRLHEGYQALVRNSQSYSNHQLPSWPAPSGPPPNHSSYNLADVSSRPPLHNSVATGEVLVDEDFLRETDNLIHGFKPSMTPIPFTYMNPSSNRSPNPHVAARGPPIAALHPHPYVHNPASGEILVPEHLLRETDDLINGFRPTMTPIPTMSNPHWEHGRGGIVNATAMIPIDASLIQEVDELLQNFELEPRQGKRPSWGPHRTRQALRAETPRISVDKDALDDADALIRNFNPDPVLPPIPVGRKSSWVAEGRRRRSSTVSSAGAGFPSSSANDDAGLSDDKQQSPVSQKRKARFAYMTESWEPKRSQKRRPSNADSPLRISKGLLENTGCDWSRLKPGRVHMLVGNPAFAPKGSSRVSRKDLPIREESVKYLPRSKEFSGKTHAYHLILSVCGMPGPYIMDLAEENLAIDGHDDDVFLDLGLRETKFKIDVRFFVLLLLQDLEADFNIHSGLGCPFVLKASEF